jgi:phage-related protein
VKEMSSSSLGNVVVAIKAVDEASGVMGKIQSSLGLLGGALQNLGGGFAAVGTVVQGFAAGGVAGAAIGALGEVAKGLQDCIKEATSSEAVFASLGAAVTRSGTAWDTVSEATKNALLAMQKTTTYSDEELAAALERLMTFGLSYDDAMKALGKTLDFASAKHMDLETAATLVGKAMDGNTAILKRYGVDVATSKDAAVALKDAHDAAATAIKAMGGSVDAWVTSVTTAIGADSAFGSGLTSAKDKAQYLIDQFQQGNIDLPQFTQAMTSLGVQLDETKMKGGTAEEVLSKLNEQFGGAAGEAAKTYAGTQERLKNATEEVGERIGTIFLPALTSLTEGMIPVVDWLGQGVDAITGWMTEVGKMPEVQGAITFVTEAFQGLGKYLGDVWKFMQDTFGPALTELMGAFKELWDALSPIGDALKELLGIFGDTGNLDLLKMAISFVVLEIRAVADIIKEVAPYIKAFAQAFRDAADFVTPILTQIVAAIRAFTADLQSVFQAFYDWLVGGSLCTDIWNQVVMIAGRMIGQMLTDLGTKLFSPMQTAFTDALQQVQSTWSTGWQSVQTTFNTITSQVQTDLNTRLDTMIVDLRESTNQYAPTAAFALQGMQGSMNAGMSLIHGDWQGGLTQMQTALGLYWQAVQSATGIAFATLQGTWSTSWQAIQTTFNTITSQVQSDLNTRLNTMIADLRESTNQYAPTAASALQGMQSTMNGIMLFIRGDWQGALTSLQNALNSYWQAAQSATTTAFAVLQGLFTGGMSTIRGILDAAIAGMEAIWTAFIGFMSQGLGQLQGILGAASASVTSTVATMQTAAGNAVSGIQATLSGAWNAITQGAQSLLDALVGHSIWTDMLDEMQAQTASALGNILGNFQGTFGNVAFSVPTVPVQTSTMQTSARPAPALSPNTQLITIPITVMLDGQVISKSVKKILIEERQYRDR